MTFEELLNKPLPVIPENIAEAINRKDITLTPYEDKNDILSNEALQQEAGYRFFEDGSALVSMYCPMPGITAEMINWWFWWHVQDPIRYNVWYPGAHFGNSYDKKNAAYFKQKTMPEFQPNIQYPKEQIGGVTSTLVIKFQNPADMGFSKELMAENDIPVIVCGHVGVKHAFMHTEMTHIFKETHNGLFMFSRFWMGESIKSNFLRKKIMTDSMVRGMAEHCCIEYRNLAEILPDLFNEFTGK